MSLIPNPSFDRPGFCCLCHIPIAEFDGPTIVRILPIARPMYLRLNDDSMLNVTLCDKCKDNFTEKDVPAVMESVYKGWRQEIEFKGWSREAKDAHLEAYGSKYITECAEKGITKQSLTDAKVEFIGAVEAVAKKEALAKEVIVDDIVVGTDAGAGI